MWSETVCICDVRFSLLLCTPTSSLHQRFNMCITATLFDAPTLRFFTRGVAKMHTYRLKSHPKMHLFHQRCWPHPLHTVSLLLHLLHLRCYICCMHQRFKCTCVRFFTRGVCIFSTRFTTSSVLHALRCTGIKEPFH